MEVLLFQVRDDDVVVGLVFYLVALLDGVG